MSYEKSKKDNKSDKKKGMKENGKKDKAADKKRK